MTDMEKFQGYEQAALKYTVEAREALESAKAAKEANRKSDYDFWLTQYKHAMESAAEFQYKIFCCCK